MSAHTLLVAHNVAVLDALLTGVRTSLSDDADQDEAAAIFAREVTRFEEVYDGAMSVLHTARDNWKDVKYAQGKGRLAREAQKDKDVRSVHSTEVYPFCMSTKGYFAFPPSTPGTSRSSYPAFIPQSPNTKKTFVDKSAPEKGDETPSEETTPR
ncbi:hypothetical protein DFJ58DRAFT_742958 [Suillus subalutaceus]|uniref:uncharacterized protein n=1 Tax=Suillus subalutaceus TaxID=48586 RepID=UPI001B861437|nr:uncharacterized protein DFJ58DRAFT_742958 [Suillus subalutaceus]KAG1867267.1 hypothetical protein DFJ58DRAFT_742958 [Suillus subalutaceus]